MNDNINKVKTGVVLIGGITASILFLMKNSKIKKLKSEKYILNNELSDERGVNKTLKTEIEKLKNNNCEVDCKKIINQSLRIEELHKKISILREEVTSRDKEIKTLKNQYSNLESKYKTDIQHKDDELASLYHELEIIKSKMNLNKKSDSSNIDLHNKIQELNDTIESLSKEIETYKMKIIGQTEKNRELKNQIREKTNELDTTKEELALFKSCVKDTINATIIENESLKELSKVTDRVSKKVNKKTKPGGR